MGRRYVTAPSVTPLRFGLLSAADEVLDGDVHWENGVDFQPDSCEIASATVNQCGDAIDPTKAPTQDGFGARGATPFAVYAWIRCSPAGGFYDEIDARTTAALTQGEGRALEDVFWTGVTEPGATVLPHLAEDTPVQDTFMGSSVVILQTAATVVTGTALEPKKALAALEGALAQCYGAEGVIHVPYAALSLLEGPVKQDGQRLRTLGGHRVAAYSSGNRQGPTGAAAVAGNAWFYATGAVNYRRSGIRYTSTIAESLDRSNNTMVRIAERTYVIGWDCCHFAQQANLGV